MGAVFGGFALFRYPIAHSTSPGLLVSRRQLNCVSQPRTAIPDYPMRKVSFARCAILTPGRYSPLT